MINVKMKIQNRMHKAYNFLRNKYADVMSAQTQVDNKIFRMCYFKCSLMVKINNQFDADMSNVHVALLSELETNVHFYENLGSSAN